MPRVWKPRSLGLYRVAAIALFRALLIQSRAATRLDVETRTALQNAVRNRFRSNANLVSVRHTKIAYHAGYHGLDLLDACVAGEESATNRIEELIEKTPAYVKEAPKPKPPKLSKQEQRKADGEPEGLWGPSPWACPPPGKKMLDVRPYQQIKGERRVPSFTAAQSSLPFLRFKKPQPLNLTRVIWQKLEQKSRRIDHESILANYYMPLAEAEDIWDGIVERTLVNEDVVADWRPRTWTGGGEAWRSEDAWTWTYREGLRDVRGRLWRTRAQALDMGRRMQEVVEREEALAEEEMRQREEKAIEVTL